MARKSPVIAETKTQEKRIAAGKGAERSCAPSHGRRGRRAIRRASARNPERARDRQSGQPARPRSCPASRREHRAHHRHGFHRRPGARPGGGRHRRADRGSGRRRDLGPHHERGRRGGRRGWPDQDRREAADPRAGTVLCRPVDRGRDSRHRHQGGRSAGALRQGRQDRPVRRRWRRQDRADHGADQQRGQGPWRLFGVRRRRRAHARGQRSLSRDDRVRREQGPAQGRHGGRLKMRAGLRPDE